MGYVEVDIVIAAYEKYVHNDKKARSIILTFIEPDVELLFEDYPSAHPFFKKIGKNYGETSQTHIRMLVV